MASSYTDLTFLDNFFWGVKLDNTYKNAY
jgi:hypothetical protein